STRREPRRGGRRRCRGGRGGGSWLGDRLTEGVQAALDEPGDGGGGAAEGGAGLGQGQGGPGVPDEGGAPGRGRGVEGGGEAEALLVVGGLLAGGGLLGGEPAGDAHRGALGERVKGALAIDVAVLLAEELADGVQQGAGEDGAEPGLALGVGGAAE